MRVLFLQRQPCIRTLKYAVGLRATGRDLELGFACQGATLTGWYGAGDDLFDRWWHLDPEPADGLRRVVEEFEPDVIHSHNLPDGLTVAALDVCDVPVVHDSHDMQSLRRTPYEDGFPEPDDPLELERRAVEGCAGLVAVSAEMLAEIEARYTVAGRRLVFANYAAARDLPALLPPPRRDRPDSYRIVYQGTLSTNCGHYDLRAIFTAIVAQGASLDIYPSRPSPAYQELAAATPGMRCHEPLEPAKLLQELAGYDLGWAGFNDSLNAAHLDTVLPNKLFEYLGCGLPVLTLRHRALEDFVSEHQVGVILASVDELAGCLAGVDLPAVRSRVASIRSRFTVEANIDRLLDLYDAVTAGAPRR